MDHRCRRGRRKQSRDLGNRRALAANPSRQSSSVRVPLWLGSYRPNLFRGASIDSQTTNERMTNDELNPNDELRKRVALSSPPSVIRASSFLRHSTSGI